MIHNTKAAIRYAKAVLSLAIDKKIADEVNENMQLIANTIDNSKTYRLY